ncbi:QsdR family transcriptional regulator [Streptomyces sp. NPDC001380]|uniref:QsdR family transcriptional regulator n=1 Tax=Streptomyces sp. NPDC001380 TaxID=3364566 RepID=UPI0036B05D46
MSHRTEGKPPPAAPGQGRTPPPSRDDLLELARTRFQGDGLFEMRELADALGVSRATVYRWAGNRELLLGEVLWDLTGRTLAWAREQARGDGAPYLVEVFERFVVAVDESAPLCRFLLRDPELALRVLTSRHGVVQTRLVAAVRDMLRAAEERGSFRPAIDLDTLAYAAVRLGEAFVCSDVITGTDRDVRRAVDVLRLLLRGM